MRDKISKALAWGSSDERDQMSKALAWGSSDVRDQMSKALAWGTSDRVRWGIRHQRGGTGLRRIVIDVYVGGLDVREAVLACDGDKSMSCYIPCFMVPDSGFMIHYSCFMVHESVFKISYKMFYSHCSLIAIQNLVFKQC